MTDTTDGGEGEVEHQEEEKVYHSIYFLVFSSLLAAVLVASKLLHRCHALKSILSEAALVLILGIIVGAFMMEVLRLRPVLEEDEDDDQDDFHPLESLLSFSSNIFFMALLPPILFWSGYQLRRELFYRHLAVIVTFATIGTSLSAIIGAFTLHGMNVAGAWPDFDPTMLEFLAFGSLIAATDTVSVIAVLQAKKVDPRLFYVVFGESALNDAVALVLYKTFATLLKEGYHGEYTSLSHEITTFVVHLLYLAIGSPVLGTLYGFLVALGFQQLDIRNDHILEMSLYLLIIYVPYMIAECLDLSGIVAIFFTGIAARRYISPTLSEETRKNGQFFFQTAAYLAETCIFLELGLSVFGLNVTFNWSFIGIALLTCLFARACSIYPLAFLYNASLREFKQVNLVQCGAVDRVRVDDTASLPDRPTSPVIGLIRWNSTDEGATSSHSGGVHKDGAADDSIISNNSSKNSRKKTYEPSSPSRPPPPHTSTTTSATSFYKRKTPKKRLDKKISLSMAHVLWFAGLRGAVAYACVRDFPDYYGHQDEFIAATMVIVLFTIIIMGGAMEYVLDWVGIETGVDEDDYMEDWHKHRGLKGSFHDFEMKYLYACIIRKIEEDDDGDGSDDDIVHDYAMYNSSHMTSSRYLVLDSPRPYSVKEVEMVGNEDADGPPPSFDMLSIQSGYAPPPPSSTAGENIAASGLHFRPAAAADQASSQA